MKEMSRRSFLKAGTAATAALALSPSDLLAKAKAKKNVNTGKIKLLGVGVGGRGHMTPERLDRSGVCFRFPYAFRETPQWSALTCTPSRRRVLRFQEQ